MDDLERWQKVLIWFGISFVGLLIFWGLFRLISMDFVENYEVGYMFDRRTGEITKLNRTGYFVTWPIVVQIHTIDLRPGQVCMNANARVLNCKLVRFNVDALDTFIQWHGRGAGSGATGDIYEILKSYAFNVNEGRDCPFLTILDDMRRKPVGQAGQEGIPPTTGAP